VDLYKSIDKKTSGVTIKRLVKESFTCMLNQLIRDFMFKKDFFDFLQIIKRSSDDSEIKKKYLFMVKKYHPDTAPNGFESIYNEYMILINKAYSKDKTNVKEITFDEKNTNNIYVFYDYYGREKKYKNFLEYVFHLGQEEYNTGLLILSSGTYEDCYLNKQQKFNVNDTKNIYDAIQYLCNSAKCFSYIIENCPNYIFIEDAKELFQKVVKLNNNLSNKLNYV